MPWLDASTMRPGLKSPPAQSSPLGDFNAFDKGGNGASPRSQGIIPPHFPGEIALPLKN
jgi:hypothetical protein